MHLILALMFAWIVLVKIANPLHEFLCSSLFKEAHKGRSQGFGGAGGDFCDSGSGALSLLDVTASYLSELEVSCYVGGDEDVGEFAIGHEEFGYQIDVPIIEAAIFLPWFFAFLEIAVSLEKLGCCQPVTAGREP